MTIPPAGLPSSGVDGKQQVATSLVDATNPADLMTQFAVALLALFGTWKAPMPWKAPRWHQPGRVRVDFAVAIADRPS